MRRKSTRNAQKPTPEKSAKETESPKTRRSKRRKRTPSKSSDSEDEAFVAPKRGEPEETPDTTTKSHTPTDEETSEEPMWKVTSSEEAPQGEIQKLKLCLTRPSPDSPDKSKSRRSKSNSQTEDDATSSEDKSSTRRTRSRGSPVVRNDGLSSQEGDEDVEDKKGKGKSKGKHKSKIEKSPHLSEPEIQTNNEISENVQVTPQSPSIDKPVDNESDYNKVDVDVKQNVNENTQKQGNDGDESAKSVVCNPNMDQDNVKDVKKISKSEDDDSHEINVKNKDSDDDEPLSVIQKSINAQQEKPSEMTTEEVISSEDPKITDVVTNVKVQQEISQPQNDQNDSEISLQAKTEDSEKQESSRQQLKIDSDSGEVEPLHSTQTEDVEKASESSVEKASESSAEKASESLAEKTSESSAEKESESSAEKTIMPEEPLEHQHSISEDISGREVEETNPTNNCETNQVRKPSETPSEVQVSPSRNFEEVTTSKQSDQKGEARPPRRRLKRNNEPAQSDSKDQDNRVDDTCGIRPFKNKRKWEGGTNLISSSIKIDLESIQTVWPSIEFPEEPDLSMDSERERRKSVAESSAKRIERKVSLEYKSDSSEKPSYEKQTSVNSSTQDSEDNSNIIAFNRKISIVDDTASKLKPPPSPAKNPVSEVLFITNLVRPFTLKQLKELLERTGKIQEEGFWTDRIKSKCYVQYETVEEAESTRNALHGVQWPIGNGKKLIIDYATPEDLKNAKNPPPPPVVAPAPDAKTSIKENVEPVESKSRNEEVVSKEVEKKKSEGPVREWDIGKKDVRRERSRSRERSRKHRRSPTPSEDFISRKQRKAEESVPQKLMDDLFLKTKATPSIYWQPLSPEEISMKQQQRLIRMEEHKRRMEENSRMKGREMGRGAFRRRYD